MGVLDDAKDLAKTAGEAIAEKAGDLKEMASDALDGLKADANVKKAEAEKEVTDAKNEAKEAIRENK